MHRKVKIMDQNYLDLLTEIKNTLEEIKELEQDLNITDPAGYLERLTEIRNALAEVRGLQEEVGE